MDQSITTVTVSSKYQVVIPKEIRKVSGLKAGTKMSIIQYGNRIELIPIVPIKNLRGAFKGIDTKIERDQDRI
jgi:AbrB family looped-hinge helix DNA binding protein